MKSRFLLLLWITSSFIGSLAAQTATDPNEGLRITKDSSGVGLTLFWYGRTGRTYFVQQSPDLLQWKYLPIMDSGAGAPLSYGVSTTTSRGFFRLSSTDDPLASDPDGDFDGDGISNMDELLNAQYGYDPFDYFNGLTPTLSLLGGGGQWGQPGAVLPQPISVSVNSGAWNAPVSFAVSSGGALLSADGNVPWSSLLTVRSSSGNSPRAALAYVKLPAAGGQSNITITAGFASKITQLQTTATTYDAAVPVPTALQSVMLSDSAVRLNWVPADATRATTIEISTNNGASWQVYDVAAPGVSSFIINGLSLGQQVLLRTVTGDKSKTVSSTVEPLSAPSPPVTASSMGPLIIDVYEKIYDYGYTYNIYYSFDGYVEFLGYDLLLNTVNWQSALSILDASTDRRNEVLETFAAKPFDELAPYTWLTGNQTFTGAIHYHGYFQDVGGPFSYREWGYSQQLLIRQDSIPTPDPATGPATVADTATYLVLGEHGNGFSEPNVVDYTGTLTFTKYSDATSHTDYAGNLPEGTIVVGNTAQTVTLKPYSRSDDVYNNRVRLVPLAVEWIPIDDNWQIEDNKDADGKWMPGKGKRMFVDAKSQDETDMRDAVYVKVTGAPEGTKLYLKAFDVDDPTPDSLDPEHIIDSNDNNGIQRGYDNRGYDSQGFHQPPHFVSSEAVTVTCTADQYGVARLDNGELPKLKMTDHPGDNVRVAVTFYNAAGLSALQVGDSTQPSYVPPSDEIPHGFYGVISPMLTIWRKLNVEIDSMTAVPESGSEKNFEDGTIAAVLSGPATGQSTVRISITLKGAADRYQNGQLMIGSQSYKIISNTDNLVTGDDVIVTGAVPTSTVGQSFKIRDDDDHFLAEVGLPAALPQDQNHEAIIKAIRPKYAPAYIQVEDATKLNLNKRSSIPFKLNEAPTFYYWGSAYGSMMDIHDTETFWCITLALGYQFEMGHDNDPNDDKYYVGNTPKSQLGATFYSVIAMEHLREKFFNFLEDNPGAISNSNGQRIYRNTYMNNLYGSIAHEIGHSPGGQDEEGNHDEGGLMVSTGATIDKEFTAESINRFRKASQWSK